MADTDTSTEETDTDSADTDVGSETDTDDVTDQQPDPAEAVGKAAAKARRQASSATRKEIAEKLGVSIDEAAAIIAAAREKEDAEKSEAQRAKEAADKAAADAVIAIGQARSSQLKAELKAALLSPGADPDTEPACPADRLNTVISMALPLALAAETDDTDEAVATAVAALRESDPWMFVDASGSANGTHPTAPGPGRKIGEKSTPKSGVDAVAAKIAAMREGQGETTRLGLRPRR